MIGSDGGKPLLLSDVAKVEPRGDLASSYLRLVRAPPGELG